MTKIRPTKIFHRRSDEVKIALLGYMKPVCGLPDHHRLFFFSHVTNSIRVRLAPCVAYTYLRLSRKIFGAFNFCRCAQRQKFLNLRYIRTGNQKLDSGKAWERGYYIAAVGLGIKKPGNEATTLLQ